MSAQELPQRMDLHATAPEAYKPMIALEKYVHSSTLGEGIISLVKLRASQINGCAYCLSMHGEEGRKAGVSQQKIDIASAWHEAPQLFSEREQAALAFTEEVTRISEHGVSDAVWNKVKAAFNDDEVAHLLMAIIAINGWNRIAVTTHMKVEEK